MGINNAGLDVSGANNPNWKGGMISKKCEVCGKSYEVKKCHIKSRFCSLKCVGIFQRGRLKKEKRKITIKNCIVCGKKFEIPSCHAYRQSCCSKKCSSQNRSLNSKGFLNPNWQGGLSRLPYPWNFREVSKKIIERDNNTCQNPSCTRTDSRLTTHHINYDKQDCRGENLICLCSSCNSKANFKRDFWEKFYMKIIESKKNGGGWKIEDFS